MASAAGETGCNSPGFERQQIYSIEEMHAHGSLASKFRVRQTAQSLYIRRRLVEKHSPVVYLEVHLDVQDENTRTMPPPGATAATASVDDEWVLVTRFECPERALPLGVESYGSKNGDGSSSSSSSAWSTIMSAFSPADEDDSDQLVNPSTSVFGSSGYNDKGIHWSVYAIFFGAALCGLTILYLVAFSRRKLLVRNKMRTFRAFGQTTRISVDDDDNDNDYAKSKQAAETSIITRWMAAGSRRGLFTSMARDIDVLSLLESGKSRHDKLP